MSVGLHPKVKYEIVEDYLSTENKTATAKKFGVSPRTVGRVIKEYEGLKIPYSDIFEKTNQLVMPDNHVDDIDMEAVFMLLDSHVMYQFIRDYYFSRSGDFTTIGQLLEICESDIEDVETEQVSVITVDSEEDEEDSADDISYSFPNHSEETVEYQIVATPQSITVTKSSDSGTDSVDIARGTEQFRKAWGLLRGIDMTNQDDIDSVAEEIFIIGKPVEAIEKFSQGLLTVDVSTETIFYNGYPVSNSLTNRIIHMVTLKGVEGAKSLINFLEKLMENPSYRAVNSLYDFLNHNDIEINEAGNFYAWKRVTSDYKDCYTKTIDNSVGAEPSMPRNLVNEDPNQTCSYGLHVAARSYLKHYNGAIVIKCEVDPRDVVAIPRDYNNAKMRTCRYKVVEDVTHMNLI